MDPQLLTAIRVDCEELASGNLPEEHIVVGLCDKVKELYTKEKNIVNIEIDNEIFIVGDTHGQFQDVYKIFQKYGYPSSSTKYLFNGDYVDRGDFGMEILIMLFAWKLAVPEAIHLNRGNHESDSMNKLYGFRQECRDKYPSLFPKISQVFNSLPLGHIVNGSVLVVHGGLSLNENCQPVTIDQIQQVNRFQQPDDGIMRDILWADPMDDMGSAPSPRGNTTTFGPDVTEKFLADNQLGLLIRSHQVKENGYEIMHNGMLISVFSASNYMGTSGNKGAVIRLVFGNANGSGVAIPETLTG